LSGNPTQDLAVLSVLEGISSECFALARQLGDRALALEQAELAKSNVEKWIRAIPETSRSGHELATAWERIAKARWAAGKHEQALAAFREKTAIERQVLAGRPSDPTCRARLSRCYDQLIFYGSRGGDLRGAADAILERDKLSPHEANKLAQSAEDFETLADRVSARAHGRLTRQDQAERDRYVAESRRLREAAKAIPRR
jgi:hypothetical protein